MSALDKLASALGRADEVPNQLLAKDIAATSDRAAVRELVGQLDSKNRAIQHDCIKVLYEVGYLQPDLVAAYVNDFIKLLRSRDNRMVWGGMTALGTIAGREAGEIWKQIGVIMDVTDKGSAITQDWGIRVLATVSAQDTHYEDRILPFLLTFLKNCRPKDLPRHAESCLVAVTVANRATVLPILEARKSTLKAAQAKRIEKVIRAINAL
jgi:hypothetical protein